jgi:hypothetical protein
MTTQMVNPPVFGQTATAPQFQANWSRHIVHFLQSRTGYGPELYLAFGLSLTCGAIAGAAIHYFAKDYDAYQRKPLLALFCAPFVAIMIVVSFDLHKNMGIIYVILNGSYLIGLWIMKRITDNSEHRIGQLAVVLEQDQPASWEFKLKEYDRGIDLSLLREELKKSIEAHRFRYLNLSALFLTDSDLVRFKESKWLDCVKELDLTGNQQITGKAVLHCGDELEVLNLTNCDLTNEDLGIMAKSGKFKQLKWLILQNNPKLTWDGLREHVGGEGFAHLERLDLSGNPHLTKQIAQTSSHTNEVFKSLTALELQEMQLDEEAVRLIIEKFLWMRRLKGLKLFHNPSLCRLPKNIMLLKESLADAHHRRRDKFGRHYCEGLYLDNVGGSKMEPTNELKELLKSRKVPVHFTSD